MQEYLKELLENTDQKLLVFAHHKDLLDGVEFIMNKCAALHPASPASLAASMAMPCTRRSIFLVFFLHHHSQT